MVKNLVIQCPNCHESSELFLSSNAAIIVLNCPHCWTPIISNRSGVYVLPEKSAGSTAAPSHEFDILQFLRSMSATQEPVYPVVEKRLERQHGESRFSSPVSGVATCRERETIISQDEITNLRIKLATCQDASDFIEEL